LEIVVFDDPLLSNNFKPLTYTRATFELPYGSDTILENLLNTLKPDKVTLLVPNYLEEVVKERHPNLTINPESVNGDAILVNGFFNTGFKDLLNKVSSENQRFVILDRDFVAAGEVRRAPAK
jgi:hypothetical protein